MYARAFVKTGLGKRIALTFIKKLGSSSLRLGYSLALTDLVLAPVTPSNTARTGGMIFPVARSLVLEFDSKPGPSARRIGSFLLFTAYQVNVVTSAMFMTAMAANAIAVQLAQQTVGVEISWGQWALAASLPGLIALLTVPLLIYLVYPPELKQTPQAQEYAAAELAKMGPISAPEKTLATVFIVLALTWATAVIHSITTIAAALAAVTFLLLWRVLEWNDIAGEKRAWETFIWFGGFISLASALTDTELLPLVRLHHGCVAPGLDRLHCPNFPVADLRLCSLLLRRHDRSDYCSLRRLCVYGGGGRRASFADGVGLLLFFQSLRLADALFGRRRTGLLRFRLHRALRLVAYGIPDFFAELRHLAGRGFTLVALAGDLVAAGQARGWCRS